MNKYNVSTMNNLSNDFIAKITEFEINHKSHLYNEKETQIRVKKALSNLHEKYGDIIDASDEIANFKEIKVLYAALIQKTEERKYGNLTSPRIESKSEKEIMSESLMDIWDYNIITTSPRSFLILPSLKIVKCNECRGSGNHQYCNGSASIDCSACRGRGISNCKGIKCVNGKCAECAGRGDVQCTGCGGYRFDRGRKLDCSRCRGGGRIKCQSCRGSGACPTCNGRGELSCTSCQGYGRKKCSCTNGKCLKCEGYGELENYDTLDVDFSEKHNLFRSSNLHDIIRKGSYDKFASHTGQSFNEIDLISTLITNGCKTKIEVSNAEEFSYLNNQLQKHNIELSIIDFSQANSERTKSVSCSLNDMILYSFNLMEDISPIYFTENGDTHLFIPSNHKLLVAYKHKILKEQELLEHRQQIYKKEKLKRDKLKLMEEDTRQKLEQLDKQKIEKASFDKELELILSTGDIDKAIKKATIMFNMNESKAKSYVFKLGIENGYKDIITSYENEEMMNSIRGALFLFGLFLGWYFYKWWIGIILGFIFYLLINSILRFWDKK